MPRERGPILSRRPGESRDPYAAADVVRKLWATALLQQLLAVAMGPGLRRGDAKNPSPPKALDLRHAAVAVDQLHRDRFGCRRELEIRRRVARDRAGIAGV